MSEKGQGDKNVLLSQKDRERVDRFWENTDNVLRLIDLIFLADDNNRLPPS